MLISLAAMAPMTSWAAATLTYTQAAGDWLSALPLGNGHIGAMVFGDPSHERIGLNDSTFYSGSPTSRHAPDSADALRAVRAAVAAGDYSSADNISRRFQGPWTEAYMPLGDLTLDMTGMPADVTGYARSLDINRGVNTTQYTAGGVTYTREAFTSFADDVLVLRLTADQPGHTSIVARLSTKMHFAQQSPDGASTIVLTGKAPLRAMPSYTGGKLTYADSVDGEGMTFAVRVRAIADGGKVSANADGLTVANANAVTLILSTDTSYNGPTRSPGKNGIAPGPLAANTLNAAAGRSYDELLSRHLAAYQPKIGRAGLTLGPTTAVNPPTTERVANYAAASGSAARDEGVIAILFDYGRYLCLSASRPGRPPANLQGIWNDSPAPPWSSNYTTNINTEMNYWLAEPTNLANVHESLIDWIRDTASVSGAETARRAYGLSGWTIAHNSDLWGTSWMVGAGKGEPIYASWPMGGAWLVDHVWQHYAFDPDDAYLRHTAYPLMRGAAQFCLGLLVDDGHGRLISVPSTSPEDLFIAPDGKRHAVSASSTMDCALMRELFKHCAYAADRLGIDSDFAAKLRSARAKLIPYQVCDDGTLAEWANPAFKTFEVHHRHLSHLIGLFPLADVTDDMTDVRAAIRRSLDVRGDESTGWSTIWKTALWARLGDGDRALKVLRTFVRPVGPGHDAGVYTNLFGSCPPFQMDANFGFAAAVTEMLLQSQQPYIDPAAPKVDRYVIDLLPALPAAWPDGTATGLRARGGFEVTMTWHDHRLTSAKVSNPTPRPATGRVRYAGRSVDLTLQPGQSRDLDPDLR